MRMRMAAATVVVGAGSTPSAPSFSGSRTTGAVYVGAVLRARDAGHWAQIFSPQSGRARRCALAAMPSDDHRRMTSNQG